MPHRRRPPETTTPARPPNPRNANGIIQTPPLPHPPFVSDPSVEIVNGNATTPAIDETMADEPDADDTEEDVADPIKEPPTLPPTLREISPLASWTVSTHKPGCGIPALRHPSPLQFWQSDGPQPHTLTLHFFKLVSIVKIRVYLDFELDESYTPTKMEFAAGMGGNDLVGFSVWEGEGPRGWVDVDLSGVGGAGGKGYGRRDGEGEEDDDAIARKERRMREKELRKRIREKLERRQRARLRSENGEISEEDEEDARSDLDWEMHGDMNPAPQYPNDVGTCGGDVLKAMVLQVRICENHQNGKDTHVRGFQVFARDDRPKVRKEQPRRSRGGRKPTEEPEQGDREGRVHAIEEADWMGKPEIR